ncbi:DUF4377 domain-containing protein [Kaistella flava (ex Peng et al. 2021)]|uniref:DUF4377 domain-containing protein n=1 Tax=Kaistella flava (ex Peng et al. 2021) TaxID=2038776 RepID=UPI001FC89EF1|nr:DUF4377 domain-containing protein [Kaistella flava (ex Peng et al. 2021)]
MKKIIYFLSMFALVALLTISCNRDENTDQTSTVTASVYHKYADYAIPPDFNMIKAIKIKESNSGEWVTIVGIDGFIFEENFEYQLKLKKNLFSQSTARLTE